MSAFLMNDRALSVVADTVAECAERGKLPGEAQEILESLGAWRWIDSYGLVADREVLFNALGSFNLERVNIRYPDDDDGTPFDGEYTKGLFLSPCAQLKQIHCFMYQCSEGDNYETCSMFKLVKMVEHALMYDIVAALPAYKTADWGNVPETASQVVNILDLL